MNRDDFNSTSRLRLGIKPLSTVASPTPTTRAVRRQPWRYDELNLPGQAPKDTFPYWAVWNKHRPWCPRFRHPSEASATSEAARLAALRPGRRFYVVRVEGFHMAPVVSEQEDPIA